MCPFEDGWGIELEGGYIMPQAEFLAVELEYFSLSNLDLDQGRGFQVNTVHRT